MKSQFQISNEVPTLRHWDLAIEDSFEIGHWSFEIRSACSSLHPLPQNPTLAPSGPILRRRA
jgi:hypothetical protein